MPKLYRPDGPPSGEPCTVAATSSGLQARIEDVQLTLPWRSIEAALGGWEDSWALFKGDGGEIWIEVVGLDALNRDAMPTEFGARFDALRSTHGRRTGSRFAIRAVSLVLFLALVGWFFSGGLVGLVLRGIPTDLEVALGKVAGDTLVEDQTPCEDPAVLAAVTGIVDRLAAEVADSPYPLTVRVMKSDEVNAFALPGGSLFVNSALLEETGSEHELAAVLGHEVQHALRRHGLKRILTQAGSRLLLMFLLGDASEAAQIVGVKAADLGNLSFGRDQEREADELGLALMAAAGFDPQGGVAFFGRLAELTHEGSLDRALSFTKTHPASSERQERLRELAAATTPAVQGLDVDWSTLRTRCSSL
jgi:beta-barrel assembly-enhancing protease